MGIFFLFDGMSFDMFIQFLFLLLLLSLFKSLNILSESKSLGEKCVTFDGKEKQRKSQVIFLLVRERESVIEVEFVILMLGVLFPLAY